MGSGIGGVSTNSGVFVEGELGGCGRPAFLVEVIRWVIRNFEDVDREELRGTWGGFNLLCDLSCNCSCKYYDCSQGNNGYNSGCQ